MHNAQTSRGGRVTARTMEPMGSQVERIVSQLTWLGGTATRAELRAIDDRSLRGAVSAGAVTRDSRGRYALPQVDIARRAAWRLHAVQSHRSAALAHGLKVATAPTVPELVVPRGRRLTSAQKRGVTIVWRDLSADELRSGVTSPLRTVLDCLRDLPPRESLAVADSALRQRLVNSNELLAAAGDVRGAGSKQARLWAARADGRAANPFESRLRLIGLDVEGLRLVPQVTLRCGDLVARADLVDERLGIVAEADSFEWHGGRDALVADCARYNAMATCGWVVLRFSFEEVFRRPDSVAETLRAAVALRTGRVGPAHRRDGHGAAGPALGGPWNATLAEPGVDDWPTAS